MSLFKQNEYFYRVRFFSAELNFLKGDTNIYFEYITLFEKKKKFFLVLSSTRSSVTALDVLQVNKKLYAFHHYYCN